MGIHFGRDVDYNTAGMAALVGFLHQDQCEPWIRVASLRLQVPRRIDQLPAQEHQAVRPYQAEGWLTPYVDNLRARG